ncbi:hypothetical protein ABIE64_003071, partial [Thalassospira sp. MBR-102]
TDPAALNKHPPPSVDAANAPHPKGHTLPHGRHTTPAIDDRPFGTSERTTSPLTTDPASRSGQTDPIPPSQARCPRHCQPPPTAPRTDPAALNKHPPPSVDAANAPHPKGHTLPHGRHTTPAIDDRPFGMSERTIGPLTTDPACRSPPADPVPIQSGRNSGPLILGIVTLHRPD